MKNLIIAETSNSPAINFNISTSHFSISGNSYSSGSYDIFQEVIQWLEEYAQHPAQSSLFEFKLIYVNSSSGKSISRIITIIKDIAKTNDVKVKWYYQTDDEDIKEMGEEYAQFLGFNIEIIAHD